MPLTSKTIASSMDYSKRDAADQPNARAIVQPFAGPHPRKIKATKARRMRNNRRADHYPLFFNG